MSATSPEPSAPEPGPTPEVKAALDAAVASVARDKKASPAPPVKTADLEKAHALLVKIHLTECESSNRQVEDLLRQAKAINDARENAWKATLEAIAECGRYPELDLAGTWQAGEGSAKGSVLLKRLDKKAE